MPDAQSEPFVYSSAPSSPAMTLTLIRKEFRQHWPWFILLGVLTCLLTFFIQIAHNANGTGAGLFSGVGIGLWLMMPFCGLIFSHLLVVGEYQRKSQLFLEGLPLSRWRMITIKFFIAIALTCFFALASILFAWLFATKAEANDAKFLGIMISSAAAWAAFAAGFFFAVGFLGRYRTIVILAVGVSLIVIRNATRIPLGDFPPFALISPMRFGLEREVWPIADIQLTWLMVAGWCVIALTLGLIKEGSIAAMLGEKMSYREKLFIGGAAVMSLLFAMLLYDPNQAEPFSIPGAVAEEWDGVQVYVSPEETNQPVDLEVSIAAELARNLARERDWLGIPAKDYPSIYIVEKSDIDEPEKISWEKLHDDKAILMYAGYREKEFSRKRLFSWTMSQAVAKISKRRIEQEDRWWVMCGLEGLWELEEAPTEVIEKRIGMAVAAVQKHGLSLNQVMGWSKYQDDTEWRSADAVAWMGLRLLRENKGDDTVRNLAKKTVVQKVSRVDGRAVFWDYTHPVRPAFARVTGESLEEFVEQWKDYILDHKTESSSSGSKPVKTDAKNTL